MASFDYDTITSLYTSGGVLQNQATYTPFTRGIIVQLRNDIDTLGEILSQTGANWTSNNYDWTHGDRWSVDADKYIFLDYITEMRSAVEDLATTAGTGAPSWTIATVNPIGIRGKTATISGSVVTDTTKDFTNVTNSTDYFRLQNGTGSTPAAYLITGHTATTLTLTSAPGDSVAGDIEYEVYLDARKSDYTPFKKTLITDLHTEVLVIADDVGTFRYYADSVNGDDTTGDGSRGNPYETWDKCATQCNSTAGNIFLFNGDYTIDSGANRIQQNDITIQGQSTDSVTISAVGTNTLTDGAITGCVINNLMLDNLVALNSTSMTLNNVIGTRSISGDRIRFLSSGTWTMNHCTLLGGDSGTSNGVLLDGSGTLTMNDCLSFDLSNAITSTGGTITTNYCAFNEVTTKHSGAGSFTNNNEVTTAVLAIKNKDTGRLLYTSDVINEASDGFDVGAYPDGRYDYSSVVSDSLTVAESDSVKITVPLGDSFTLDETDDRHAFTTTMNLSVDMFLGGIFESDKNGNISYVDSVDMATYGGTNWQMWVDMGWNNDEVSVENLDFIYNGAALDVSFDNTGGDTCEVHIAVDDGVTDYTSIVWWKNNTVTAAKSVNTEYAIDCTLGTLTGNEWGSLYTNTAQSATGVNHEELDITLKVRVYNTNSDQWSELVTVTKTYSFHTWLGTFMYWADCPRQVDDAYANHANYLAQPYHTSTSAYTLPDGTDWLDDGRRWAYNPLFKADIYHNMAIWNDGTHQAAPPASGAINDAYMMWYRKGNTIASTPSDAFIAKDARIFAMLFAGIGSNFGNYSSGTLFADMTAQVSDSGSASIANPPMSGGSEVRYTHFRKVVLRTDMVDHLSFGALMVRMPSGELMMWDMSWGHFRVLSEGATSYQFLAPVTNWNGWLTETGSQDLYFVSKDANQAAPYLYEFGEIPYPGDWSYQEYYVNTDAFGVYNHGDVSKKAVIAQDGGITPAW